MQRRWSIPASEPFALEYLPWPLARCGGLSRTMTAVTGALLGALMILMHWELLDSHTLTVPSSDPAPCIEPEHHSLYDASLMLFLSFRETCSLLQVSKPTLHTSL